MKRLRKIFKMIEWEALMWIIALVYLLFINPYEAGHFSFCAFKNLGIDFCPGCGLGRSIACLYNGDLSHSIEAHPLGLFALVIILYRIIKLIQRKYFSNKTKEVIYG